MLRFKRCIDLVVLLVVVVVVFSALLRLLVVLLVVPPFWLVPRISETCKLSSCNAASSELALDFVFRPLILLLLLLEP